jgi:hypothetical protein
VAHDLQNKGYICSLYLPYKYRIEYAKMVNACSCAVLKLVWNWTWQFIDLPYC